jgi:hypothetical protein
MPIQRGRHSWDDNFTIISNDWLRDERLSFKARGLLAYIESHTIEWQISVTWLAGHSVEGKEALRSAIAELELYGYLKREQENIGGRFGEVKWITQDPVTDYPLAENPSAENRPLKKTIDKKTIDKKIEREQFDEFWNLYPKKIDKTQAVRQFKRALNRVNFEDILAGVIRFSADPNLPEEKRFIKNPATWLNSNGWEEGPLPDRRKSSKQKTDWDELERYAKEQDAKNENN